MTDYELEVLKAIDKGRGQFGWYKIEQCLSNSAIDERGHLPEVLTDFLGRGWIRVSPGETHDVYEIADSGRELLRPI